VEQTEDAADAVARQPLRARIPTAKEVAWALTSPFASQRLKARAIYAWVCTNITYDRNVYTVQRNQVQITPADVLRCRKTSCEGYARLLIELCAAIGIEAVKVVGVAKGGGNIDERHAWNLVRLDGQWVEVDATWGSSFQSPFYFAPDPELFKWSHYAFDPAQQLSPVRFTRAEFDAQDGLRGDSDPWWREWRRRTEAGELKRFDLRLR
jgi:transglutaminase/protease-like cytokinesis protein 3